MDTFILPHADKTTDRYGNIALGIKPRKPMTQCMSVWHSPIRGTSNCIFINYYEFKQ